MSENTAPAPAASERARREAERRDMWLTARKLRHFSYRDLAAFSSKVDEETARGFCALLLRAGYVKVNQRAKPGVRLARYHLVRDTGPHPPVERRIRAVWDENLGEYAHIPEAQS